MSGVVSLVYLCSEILTDERQIEMNHVCHSWEKLSTYTIKNAKQTSEFPMLFTRRIWVLFLKGSIISCSLYITHVVITFIQSFCNRIIVKLFRDQYFAMARFCIKRSEMNWVEDLSLREEYAQVTRDRVSADRTDSIVIFGHLSRSISGTEGGMITGKSHVIDFGLQTNNTHSKFSNNSIDNR